MGPGSISSDSDLLVELGFVIFGLIFLDEYIKATLAHKVARWRWGRSSCAGAGA